MAELTERQIEFAVAAFENVAGHAATGVLLSRAERMRRAAPFLQLPWDEPTDEEWSAIFHSIPSSSARSWACEFVRRRNASLMPKPVDPRREKIAGILARYQSMKASNAWDGADEILAAIDEV